MIDSSCGDVSPESPSLGEVSNFVAQAGNLQIAVLLGYPFILPSPNIFALVPASSLAPSRRVSLWRGCSAGHPCLTKAAGL